MNLIIIFSNPGPVALGARKHQYGIASKKQSKGRIDAEDSLYIDKI